MMAASCTTSTEDTSTDGGGTGGGSTGGSSGSGGTETGGSDTGGSAGTGGSESEAGTGGAAEEAGAMSACEMCAYGNCQTQGAACEADAECKTNEELFFTCVEGGTDIVSCAAQYSGSSNPDSGVANDYFTCVVTNCTEKCSGGGDAGTASDASSAGD
jgi:hypothetical protein